jgi:CRISPR/Cas system-associated protein Csx1
MRIGGVIYFEDIKLELIAVWGDYPPTDAVKYSRNGTKKAWVIEMQAVSSTSPLVEELLVSCTHISIFKSS